MRIISIRCDTVIAAFSPPMHDVSRPSKRDPAPTPAREPKRVSNEHFARRTDELFARHAGCDYRLRITRQGKLILTK